MLVVRPAWHAPGGKGVRSTSRASQAEKKGSARRPTEARGRGGRGMGFRGKDALFRFRLESCAVQIRFSMCGFNFS